MNIIDDLLTKLDNASGSEKAEILNDLGFQLFASDPEKAESYCLQALELAEKQNLLPSKARAYYLIGIIYLVKGRYDPALENYDKALELYELLDDKAGYASTTRRIGLIYWNKLDYTMALELYLKATKLREEIHDISGLSESYNDIAFVYWNRGEFKQAMSYMLKSLQLFSEMGDSHHISIAYNRIGIILIGQKEYDRALDYLFKSLKLREELGGSSSAYSADIYCGIAEAYRSLEQFDLSLEYYNKALKVGQDSDYKEIIIIANNYIGDIHIRRGQLQPALPGLKRAFRLSRQVGLKARELESCELIASLYEKMGRYHDALRYHKLLVNLKENVFNEEKSRQITEMQTRFDSERNRREAEIYRLKNVDLSREIAERQRAENEITKYKEHLEDLVRERTAELETVNAQLTNEIAGRISIEGDLRKALAEVQQLKSQLEAENIYLQEEIRTEHNFEEIIGRSDNLTRALLKVERVASTNTTVLITGETGTGKELVARAIHSISGRKDRPLVKVNCAALPVNLIESELFGHERGAFSGAIARKIGRFELASGGTILLDEVSELPLESQAKLLRVLQEGELERLGGGKSIKIDVRIIAITNRNLETQVKQGKFRDDLYYRLNVFPIELPPLRERREDISILMTYFIQKYGRILGKEIKRVPKHIAEQFCAYDWPGNVRELKNIIERSIIISRDNQLELDTIFSPKTDSREEQGLSTLVDFEKEYISRVLNTTGWRVSGEKGAARILGLNPNTLVSKMRKLGLKRKIS